MVSIVTPNSINTVGCDKIKNGYMLDYGVSFLLIVLDEMHDEMYRNVAMHFVGC